MANAAKTAFLGLSFGAANHRLHRAVMWSLIEQCGRTDCFRCGSPMDESTYSVDHREPWLGESVALFWDMQNIEFSHLRCNVDARRRGGPTTRKISPDIVETEGHRWCISCRESKPLADFYVKRPSGRLYSSCRICMNAGWSRRRDRRRLAVRSKTA
jgi:hypothetical protein